MLETEIRIQPASKTTAPSCAVGAWLIPGSDPDRWVKEICSWPTPHHELTLILIPRTRSDRTAFGTLVIGPIPARENVSSGCLPFTTAADNLWIPFSAELFPKLDSVKLNSMLIGDNTYVWHPACGLIAAEPNDCLRFADLFSIQPAQPVGWNDADPGVVLMSRLTSISATQPPPSADEILRSGAGDIGENANEIKNIPPPDDGSEKGPLGKAAQSLLRGFLTPAAHTARFISNKVPGGATQPTMFNKLDDWANRVLSGISKNVLESRNRELHRLMKMLESDPDRGLKFALPISNLLGRGRASASSNLGMRNLNFNLGSLFGRGGASDVWDVPAELQQKMNARYRELAQREMDLGRYRRAAYIYAHLLADIPAAASALEHGQHYREAAVLYRDKLHNLDKAIECLAGGRLWTDAIQLCVENARWEQAGDLYREIGQESQATVHYETAIQLANSRSNLIEAARIEEMKLNDLEAALTTLENGWPHHAQSTACVNQTFRILREQGRHAGVQDWIVRIQQQSDSQELSVELVEFVSRTANHYPDQRTQQFAFNATQVIVSRAIQHWNRSTDTNRMLTALAKLAPEDRLLRRDCTRFDALLRKSKPAPKRAATKQGEKREIVEVLNQHLSNRCIWKSAIATRDCLLAVGVEKDSESEIRVMRTTWNIPAQQVDTSAVRIRNFSKQDLASMPISIAGPDSKAHYGIHSVLGFDVLDQTVFDATSDMSRATVGAVPGASLQSVNSASVVSSRWHHVRLSQGTLVLDVADPNGKIINSTLIGDVPETIEVLPVPFFCTGNKYYVAQHDELWVMNPNNSVDRHPFDQTIQRISGSAPGTYPRLAIAFEWGVQVLWDGLEVHQSARVCDDLYRPFAMFTRTGHLVVAADKGIEVFATQNNQLRHVGSKRLKGNQTVVALISADQSNHFTILFENGEVAVFKIPV